MSQKKDIIKSIVVLTVICIVISALLAVVNSFTAPVSAMNAAIREDEARRRAVLDAAEFAEIDRTALPASVLSAYTALDGDGEALGYIFTVTGNGFGGKITVMCAIGADEHILMCHTLDVSGETSTLGGRTAEAGYTDQYAGADASLAGVDVISGATVTSRAYEDCVRAAFEAYAQLKEAEA